MLLLTRLHRYHDKKRNRIHWLLKRQISLCRWCLELEGRKIKLTTQIIVFLFLRLKILMIFMIIFRPTSPALTPHSKNALFRLYHTKQELPSPELHSLHSGAHFKLDPFHKYSQIFTIFSLNSPLILSYSEIQSFHWHPENAQMYNFLNKHKSTLFDELSHLFVKSSQIQLSVFINISAQKRQSIPLYIFLADNYLLVISNLIYFKMVSMWKYKKTRSIVFETNVVNPTS